MVDAEKVDGRTIVDRIGENAVRKARRLILLSDLLINSIISDDYTPSEELAAAIQLTDLGNRATRKVYIDSQSHSSKSKSRASQTARSTNPHTREARLMCLLELGNGEPLVDLEAIDVDAVADAISEEVKERKIMHPHVYGGGLYSRASELFEDLLGELDYKQTMRLLEGQPQGVFQVGEWLSGPLGISRAGSNRWVPPITKIPLQHCHDVTCQEVHSTRLRTSRSATINAKRELMYSFLNSEASGERWDWPGAFVEVY